MHTASGNGVRVQRGDTPIRDRQTTTVIREAFRRWCRSTGCHCSVSAQQFTKEIAAHLQVTPEALQKRAENNRYYVFRLSEEAEKQYL